MKSFARIHLFGASGSGVTTLGKALSDKINFPYFDSDEYFWLKTDPPFTQRRPTTERNELIRSHLDQHDRWILGGSIINWPSTIFPTFDLIVFCWLPPEIRIARLQHREFERYGAQIHDDPERAKQYQEFIEWARDYDACTGIANRNIKAHEAWLHTQPKESILELRGDASVDQRLHDILERRQR